VTVEDLLAAADAAGMTQRLEGLGEVLDRGDPAATAAELDALAGELEALGVAGPDLRATLERAAIVVRVGGSDFGLVMAAIEARITEDAGDEGWGDTPEGQMYLQSLAAALVRLVGLDLEATLASARTFLANFPSVSLPFGDVDERAANWLARLHDSPAVRAALRDRLVLVGNTWTAQHPLAAEQARRWGSAPIPEDPTEDGPWVRALVALARTQL
jgi:hypothetical protein